MNGILTQIQENLSFFLACALIVGLAIAAAKLIERRLPACRRISPARRIAVVGMFSAIAMVLHILDFPVPFLAPPFYKLDFSEVPVLLCGFLLGPSAGVTCLGMKVVLKLLIKGTTTAFVGDLANFVIGCTLILPAVILYHTHKSRKNAVIGLVLGTLTMTVFGSIFNAVYLIPKFAQLYGTPLDAIISMGQMIFPAVRSVTTLALCCVAPLNLLKGAMVSVLTLLMYKHVEKPLLQRI